MKQLLQSKIWTNFTSAVNESRFCAHACQNGVALALALLITKKRPRSLWVPLIWALGLTIGFLLYCIRIPRNYWRNIDLIDFGFGINVGRNEKDTFIVSKVSHWIVRTYSVREQNVKNIWSLLLPEKWLNIFLFFCELKCHLYTVCQSEIVTPYLNLLSKFIEGKHYPKSLFSAQNML